MADETVTIRVSQVQKERWQEEAEQNPEYDSVSHMLRMGMVKLLSDDDEGAQSTGDVDVEPVLERLEDLSKVMQSEHKELKIRTATILEETRSPRDLMKRIYNRIPRYYNVDMLPTPDELEAFRPDGDRVEYYGRERDIIARYTEDGEYDEDTVIAALRLMTTEYEHAKRVSFPGSRLAVYYLTIKGEQYDDGEEDV